jgi:alkylation response protein AidB-like acyl-CoA dehydrogenase
MPFSSESSSLPSEVKTLCEQLSEAAAQTDMSGRWPSRQLQLCAQTGVFRWFIPTDYGGWEWSETEILDGYLALSQSCLTTTFILTQWNAACKRIVTSDNQGLKQELLPRMASGELFATVGISHLSTSRQHLTEPVLKAAGTADGGYWLTGYSPWVTGAAYADVIVIGATLPDGRQLLAAVPTDRLGVNPRPGAALMALTGSCTDQVQLDDVEITADEIIARPKDDVLKSGTGGGAGGLQTSTLAIGLALAAAEFLREQAEKRDDLRPIAEKIQADTEYLRGVLFEMAGGGEVMSASELRQQSNSLVLRATQAALQAAKGAGFMASHPAGRWAREAMFFLVWSCPQSVAQANLCELAQISD